MPTHIIGRGHTQLNWWPSTILTCDCTPGVIITVLGFGHPTYCPVCKKGYVAEGMAAVDGGKKVMPNIITLPAPLSLD